MEKYKPLFPMAYLILSIAAAIAFHFVGVPDTIGGIIIGAAITRVKAVPDAKNKVENKPDRSLNI